MSSILKTFFEKPVAVTGSRLVDFIVCGTQKGGTTALDAYLRMHPEVCMASEKEVHFFDNEAVFDHRVIDYGKYHKYFNSCDPQLFWGEATPIYMYWYDAPRRMWSYNPSLKLIILLRNPVERAYSHWNMERSRGADNLSFSEAIRLEQMRCRESLPLQHRVFSYVDRGYYLEQLHRLWTFFPRDQVLVLKNEDLRDRPDECLGMVADFVGFSKFGSVDSLDVHSRPYDERISPEDKKFLLNLYEYQIKALECELGWDCSDWLT